VGEERSPYGFDLGVTYPRADLDVLLPAMQAAIPAWRDAGAEVRAAVCIEILDPAQRPPSRSPTPPCTPPARPS
jgi:hypothetical protein